MIDLRGCLPPNIFNITYIILFFCAIREHMMENSNEELEDDVNNGFIEPGQKMHLRWNSQRGRIFIDGSHLTHNLELGDEIMIDNQAPPLPMFLERASRSPSKSQED